MLSFTSFFFKLKVSSLLTINFIIYSAFYPVNSQDYQFNLFFKEHDLSLLVNETKSVDLKLKGLLDRNVKVTLIKQNENLLYIYPESVFINKSSKYDESIANFSIKALSPGYSEVTGNTIPNDNWIGQEIFLRITVGYSHTIIVVSVVCGWMYFVAWSISFYPQMIINFRRKSVIGLNFDFLSLNLVGFLLYSVFNIGLFWIPEIKSEYFTRHPRGLNPVLANDVFFSIHAFFATCITISQCFIYERGDQKVSWFGKSLLLLFILVIIISAILSGTQVLHWLDFLYICSYIKLAITLIKYIPQAVMNYRRKSTVGWSIGNVLLDFTGGILSILQMILNAYNHDDWISIFGDPTKFGLGLFSVCFDILFILQHYVFYRSSNESFTNVQSVNENDNEALNDLLDEPLFQNGS